MTPKPANNRRILLARFAVVAVAPLVATPALAADRVPTPAMTEGPFYPRSFPADIDADLTRVAGRTVAALGQVLDVTGRILDRSGAPMKGVKLEVWQCDEKGQYHHVGEPAGDANFQGYGVAAVDAEGRYRFRTIKPVAYPGRTPHIHFIVREGSRARLTSQLFFEGEPGNERDGIYRRLGALKGTVTMKLADAPAASGAKLSGAIDIVVG